MPRKKNMLWFEKVTGNDCGSPFFIPNSIRNLNYDLENYERVKETINSIKFSCFEKGGKCHTISPEARCCCANCFYEGGHFESCDFIFEKDIPKLNDLFQPRGGFWVKGKGCTLPRNLRSLTCITYHCEMDRRIGTTINALRNQANSLANLVKSRASALIIKKLMFEKVTQKGYKLTNKKSTKK